MKKLLIVSALALLFIGCGAGFTKAPAPEPAKCENVGKVFSNFHFDSSSGRDLKLVDSWQSVKVTSDQQRDILAESKHYTRPQLTVMADCKGNLLSFEVHQACEIREVKFKEPKYESFDDDILVTDADVNASSTGVKISKKMYEYLVNKEIAKKELTFEVCGSSVSLRRVE